MFTNLRGVWVAAVAAVLAFAGAAAAQDRRDPAQLQKAYDDLLDNLKTAQERKNQLAEENRKLGEQVAELQKQLDRMKGEVEQSRRSDAEQADRTFFLRAHYAAWQTFIRRYPEFYGRWKAFFGTATFAPGRELPPGLEPEWPPALKGEADF